MFIDGGFNIIENIRTVAFHLKIIQLFYEKLLPHYILLDIIILNV